MGEITAKSIIGAQPTFELVVLREKQTVSEALILMWKKGISSAPLISETNEVEGMVDLLDLVTLTCSKFGINQIDVYASKIQAEKFLNQKLADIPDISGRDQWVSTKENTSLRELIQLLSGRDIKRVSIIDDKSNVVGLISQSTLIKFLFENRNKLGNDLVSRFSLKVKDIWNLTGGVETINYKEVVIDAFLKMSDRSVSGVAIVNDDGDLVGNISSGDMKRLQLDPPMQLTYDLFEPIHVFCNIDISDKVRKSDVMKNLISYKPIFVEPEDNLSNVMEKIVTNKIHRLYVVKSSTSKKPVKVISLCDLLQQFLVQGVDPKRVQC